MTHFVGLVIVPADIWNAYDIDETEEYIFRILDKYAEDPVNDEHLSFYEELDADECKRKLAKFVLRTGDGSARDMYRRGLYALAMQAIEGGGIVDGGNYGYYRNPDAFFDWVVIGGRWDGYLTGKTEIPGTPFFGNRAVFQTLENNYMPVNGLLHALEGTYERNLAYERIKEQINGSLGLSGHLIPDEQNGHRTLPHIPNSMVVSAESLIRLKRYGWFGSYTCLNDYKTYMHEVVELLKEHEGDYVVNLDFHY